MEHFKSLVFFLFIGLVAIVAVMVSKDKSLSVYCVEEEKTLRYGYGVTVTAQVGVGPKWERKCVRWSDGTTLPKAKPQK